MDKPILIGVEESENNITDVVWCPFWSKQPDIKSCEDRGTYYFLNACKNKENDLHRTQEKINKRNYNNKTD